MSGLFIFVSLHVMTVLEVMYWINAKSNLNNPTLDRTKLFLKNRESAPLVITMVVEGILVVARIIKAVGTMKKTSLERQMLPITLTLGLMVLMKFGWLIVGNYKPAHHWLLWYSPLNWDQLPPSSRSSFHHNFSSTSASSTSIGAIPSALVFNTTASFPGRAIAFNSPSPRLLLIMQMMLPLLAILANYWG